jgi:hypothetical protein
MGLEQACCPKNPLLNAVCGFGKTQIKRKID